ncbi:mechanosensitive ion channel [Roseomonas eburnea]|uniref:Small-conductance mechanosensitive channel n=1 Tax=Neoroseomonas eburnea TaxID=1346889 RepID=A0A9X9XH36_9PROT|nr:mechanosensitive ion channel family protein [Neoroseomonas eburnea]MBR0683022.1 mechanosensitive ion channel [Neoroseomonas eburnea]
MRTRLPLPWRGALPVAWPAGTRLAPPRGDTLRRIPFRRLILPGIFAVLALALHLALPAEGRGGMLRLAAGTAFWFCAAWLAARLAALLLAQHPKLLSDLVATALFVTAGVLVAQLVFELPATGLIATSSVLIAVLGFALRNTLGDIFSGIALGMESPYAIGDWIEATEGCAGRVTGIAWRATKLVTRDGVTLVVPNSLIAGHRIAVYGSGDHGRFRSAIQVPLDAAVPAERARRILLAAALEAGQDVPGFAPDVILVDLSQGNAVYAVRFHVPDYGQEMRWRDAVAGAVQRALRHTGLETARPVRDLRLRRPGAPSPEAGRKALLDALEIFRPFSAEERASLAAALQERTWPAGSAVVRQGEAGDSLFLLAEGALDVRISAPGGAEFFADRLTQGAVFGEMSLLTGQPRSATVLAATEAVVLELRKEDLDPVLRARPALLDGLTAIMVERQARNLARPAAADAPTPAAPTREDILVRLKFFFGIR